MAAPFLKSVWSLLGSSQIQNLSLLAIAIAGLAIAGALMGTTQAVNAHLASLDKSVSGMAGQLELSNLMLARAGAAAGVDLIGGRSTVEKGRSTVEKHPPATSSATSAPWRPNFGTTGQAQAPPASAPAEIQPPSASATAPAPRNP